MENKQMTESLNNNCCAECTCPDPHRSKPQEEASKVVD